MARPALLPLCLLLALVSLSHLALSRRTHESEETTGQQEDAQQCRLNSIKPSRPSQQIKSEGGLTELWNPKENQFQCAGVAPIRSTIKPKALSLANTSPQPRLVYIEQGQGLIGVVYPGCAETYYQGETGGEQEGSQRKSDEHQKIYRATKGTVFALAPGTTHWCYNDGEEDLKAVSVTDFKSSSNQLDNRLMSFYLAGGQYQEGEQREDAENIIRRLDEQLFANSLNVPEELAKKVLKEDRRGFIVKCEEGSMRMVLPDEEQQGPSQNQEQATANGVEEVYCNMRPHYNIDSLREADIYTRGGGRLNAVNMIKLPILQLLGMSAEKARLEPNAIFAPHWEMNGHTIMYVTKGEARVQVIGPNGETLCDDTVKAGDILVVPQAHVVIAKANDSGCEWLSFKTSPLPVKSPLVGKTSAFNAMPASVLANSYQELSYEEAQSIKRNREKYAMFFPPTGGQSS